MDSKQIKYVYTDLDETIVPKETKERFYYDKYSFSNLLEISPKNKQVIVKCHQKGIGFGIATGRSYQKTYPIVLQNKITMPVVALDGAQVYLGRKLVLSECLPQGLIYCFNQIANRFRQLVFLIFSDYTTYMSTTKNWLTAEEQMYLDLMLFPENDFLNSVILERDKSWDLPFHRVNTIVFLKSMINQSLQDEIKLLCKQFHAKLVIHNTVIQILPFQVSKVTGLKFIRDHLIHDLTPMNTATFGDNINDLEMLKWSQWSVAMESGHLAARNAAKFICNGVHEDGVGFWIENHILNEERL